MRDMSPEARISKGHDAVAPSWYDDLGLGQGDWEGKRHLKNSVSTICLGEAESNPHRFLIQVHSVPKAAIFGHTDAGPGQDRGIALDESQVLHRRIRQD